MGAKPLTNHEIARITDLIPLSFAARYILDIYRDDDVAYSPIYYRVIRMIEVRLRFFKSKD